jgi:hypothetical protein
LPSCRMKGFSAMATLAPCSVVAVAGEGYYCP